MKPSLSPVQTSQSYFLVQGWCPRQAIGIRTSNLPFFKSTKVSHNFY